MELLGHVGLDRVDAQHGRADPREGEEIVADHPIRLSDDRIAERDVHPEDLAIQPTCHPALGAEPLALVLDPRPCDVGMARVRADLEGHEIPEIEATGLLEPLEQRRRRAGQAEVDVSRGARALEPDFQDEPALQHRSVAEQALDAREEPIEHEQLPPAGDRGALAGDGAEPLIHGGLEGLGRLVRAWPHRPIPAACSSSRSRAGATRPRARA